ncbi:MAG: hypothetical protein WC956_02930 [bacterium]
MPANDKTASKKSSGNFWKFTWNALDRVFFIGMGVVGTVATTYITGLLKINPPELVVRETYSAVDAATPVVNNIGGLKLDYKVEAPRRYGVLRVDIANEGRGPAEKVRFQVKLPGGLTVSYQEQPDFKVYSPSTLTLDKNEFYAVLDHFPSGAHDYLALRIEGDAKILHDARIKLVNDEYEGKVETIEGIE